MAVAKGTPGLSARFAISISLCLDRSLLVRCSGNVRLYQLIVSRESKGSCSDRIMQCIQRSPIGTFSQGPISASTGSYAKVPNANTKGRSLDTIRCGEEETRVEVDFRSDQ
jgi:hypothetical protein